MGKLTVYLDKISHLQDKDGFGKADPYVQFYLEKDRRFLDKGFGKKSSSKKHNEVNPTYGETFVWDNVDSLEDMVLHIKVVDDDIGKDDFLGKCEIELEHLKMPVEIDKVIDKNLIRKDAKIYLKISFQA